MSNVYGKKAWNEALGGKNYRYLPKGIHFTNVRTAETTL